VEGRQLPSSLRTRALKPSISPHVHGCAGPCPLHAALTQKQFPVKCVDYEIVDARARHALMPGNTRGNHAEVSAAFACVKHGVVVAVERASQKSEKRTRRSSDPDPRGARSRLDLVPDFHNTYTVGRFCGRYLSSRGLHA